jgi:polyisoprenoid-binding protein YceI
MDNKTYKALLAETHPNITYVLTKVNKLEQKGSAYNIMATGNLTIAGVTKAIDLVVSGKALANGSIQFTGTKDLLMTQFNVDPPTALLGTLKTGDAITVKIDVTLEKTKVTSSLSN